MIEKFLKQNNLGFSEIEFDAYINAFICFNQDYNLAKFLNISLDISALSRNLRKELEQGSLKYSLNIKNSENIIFYSESLIIWLEQFLLVYTYLKNQNLVQTPADILEIIADFSEIKKLDIANLADNQENWQSLMDLEQHCKMGILYIFNEYNQP